MASGALGPSWELGPSNPQALGGTVDVWLADLTAVDERVEELLCERERERAERLLGDRLRWKRSRGLLRMLLGRYLEHDARALRFVEGEHGKPTLAEAPAMSFNLSHSGSLALYAFCTDAAVGVDVESVRRSLDEVAIAARVLGETTAAHLRGIADPRARRREFLRAWTRYEAELKCLGTGIGAGATDAPTSDLWVAELDLGAGAAGAVACVREPRELRRFAWA
jgi:4'-phosphopantetheinyl transferase